MSEGRGAGERGSAFSSGDPWSAKALDCSHWPHAQGEERKEALSFPSLVVYVISRNAYGTSSEDGDDDATTL